MSYRIEWNENGKTSARNVASATIADTWMGELRERGAEGVVLFRDGERIEPGTLPELTRKEAAAAGDAAES